MTGGEVLQRRERALVKGSPDVIFSVLCILLISLGSLMLFSAGSAYYEGNSFYHLIQHLKHLLVGLIPALIVMIVMTPRLGKVMAVVAYSATMVLLVAVLVFGFTSGGAKRWISVGGISLQPSEFAKTGLIMILALYYSADTERVKFRKGRFWSSLLYGIIIPLLFIGAVAVLVILEKHISGTVIIIGIGIVMMFLGGTNFVALALTGVSVFIPVVSVAFAWPYARARIEGLFNRGRDTSGADWQSTEGLYAMGTGGWFGLGIGNSRLKYGYVSQPQNDFIFAVICEELGFIGTTVIMLLFLALVARGFMLSARTGDTFCSLVIAGISFKIALHVLLNIAVVSSVIPNTGISLPFFSSGGSATMMQLIDVGLVLGCSKYADAQ